LQLKRLGPNLMRAAYVTNNIEMAFVILREKVENQFLIYYSKKLIAIQIENLISTFCNKKKRR
jgi:hypothetical protein